MATTRKYYYYRGKKLYISPDTRKTSVCFRGTQAPPLDDKEKYPFLDTYSPFEKVAIFNLPLRKTRQMFAYADKEIAIYPVYSYSRKSQSDYMPLVFNRRFFVRFSDYYSMSDVKIVAEKYQSVVLERIEGDANIFLLEYKAEDVDFLDTVNAFYEHNKDFVLYAHPDFVGGLRYEATPNLFNNQKPVLNQLRIIDAWNAISAKGIQLNEIKVAVLDEGIYHKHDDLGSGIVPQFFDCYPSSISRPYDNTNYHGTAVAGIISAASNNSIYIKGVAPKTKLVDIRISITRNGARDSSNNNVLNGLQAAINKSARVINISWTHPYSPTIEDKIKEALQKGIVVCCAAGNYFSGETQNVLFPGTMGLDTDVITVAACDEFNQLIDYNTNDGFGSRRGPAVTLRAPGRKVVTLDMSSNKYTEIFNGTSAATALVSGIAALMLGIDRNQTPHAIKNTLITNAGPNTLADAYSAAQDAIS